MEQVFLRVAQLAQRFEPELGMFLLVFGGLQEQSGDLLIAGLLGYACEIKGCRWGIRLIRGLRCFISTAWTS